MAEPPPPYSASYPNYTKASPGYPPQQPCNPPQQTNCPFEHPGYPPAPTVPYSAPQQTFQQQTTAFVLQPQPSVVLVNTSFCQTPSVMHCPFCNAAITTSLSYIEGTLTWLSAGVLFLAGCWPCCLVPFCLDDFKDVRHSCPNCHRVVGTYHQI